MTRTGNNRWLIALRVLAGVALLLVVVASGLYLLRQPLIDWAVASAKERFDLDHLDLDMHSIGFGSASIRRIVLHKDLGLSRALSIDVRDVTLTYSALSLDLDVAHIAQATVTARLTPVASDEAWSWSWPLKDAKPLVPLFASGRIDHLKIDAQTSTGMMAFTGKASWQATDDNVAITLIDDDQQLTISVDTALSQLEATLHNGATVLANVVLETINTDSLTLDANIALDATLRWLQGVSWAPQVWRSSASKLRLEQGHLTANGTLTVNQDGPVGDVTVNARWQGLGGLPCVLYGDVNMRITNRGTTQADVLFGETSQLTADQCTHVPDTFGAGGSIQSIESRWQSGFGVSLLRQSNGTLDIQSQGRLDVQLGFEHGFATLATKAVNAKGLSLTKQTVDQFNSEVVVNAVLEKLHTSSLQAFEAGTEGRITFVKNADEAYLVATDPVTTTLKQVAFTHGNIMAEAGSLTLRTQGRVNLDEGRPLELSFATDVTDLSLANDQTPNSRSSKTFIETFAATGDVSGDYIHPAFAINYTGAGVEHSNPVGTAASLTGSAHLVLGPEVAGTADVAVYESRLTQWPANVAFQHIQAQVTIDKTIVNAKGHAQLADDVIATWHYPHASVADDTIGVKLRADLLPIAIWGAPLLGAVADSLVINQGDAALDAVLQLSPSRRLYADVKLDKVTGAYQQLAFSDAKFEVTSNDWLDMPIQYKAEVGQGVIATGTPYHQLSVVGQLRRRQHLELTRAGLTVLGADVKLEDVGVDLTNPNFATAVKIDDLDFQQLLQAINHAGLSGTGRVSGTIPVSVENGALAVTAGELHSSTSGKIVYRPPAGTPTANIDNVALTALRNFHYDALTMTLNYRVNGDYQIKLRLEGKNPDLYSGYPIAFNLNLNGRLPEMLRNQLFGGRFNEEILRQIQPRGDVQ